MTSVQSEETLWSMWTLQELRSFVFMLWEVTEEVLNAAPKAQRGLMKLKQNSHFTLLFQAETTAWNYCKALKSHLVFYFHCKRIQGLKTEPWCWNIYLEGVAMSLMVRPAVQCVSVHQENQGNISIMFGTGIVNSASMNKWNKHRTRQPESRWEVSSC